MAAIHLKHYNHASEIVITLNSRLKRITCVNTEQL